MNGRSTPRTALAIRRVLTTLPVLPVAYAVALLCMAWSPPGIAQALPDSKSNLHRPGSATPPATAGTQDAAAAASLVAATTAWDTAQAAELAQPGSVAPLQRAVLQQQALSQRLRWAVAERDQQVGMARFAALDAVLAELDAAVQWQAAAAAQALPADAPAWADVTLAVQSDRLVALEERGRAAEAIALYDELKAGGADLRPYALVAAAEALAQERRSLEAVPVYEEALRKQGDADPLPADTQFGLIYAYLDVARFDDAEALLSRLEAQTPAQVRLTPVPGQPNADYSSVSGMRPFFLLYTERLDAAEKQFNVVLEEAPFNAGYAEGAAEVQRLRGQPRAALAQYEALSTTYPYDRNVRAGRAQTLLDLNEFSAARGIGASLAEDYPDSTFLRRFERQERAVTGAFFEVEANAGKGSGNALADKSWGLNARLSSGLMADAWRVFYDQDLARGETDTGWNDWARGGLGLSWQQGDWLAEAKVQQASMGPYRTSLGARVTYGLDDHWQFAATFDGNSRETPWKARAAGIGARDAGLNIGYVVNESRRFDLALQHMRYSDGNRRNGQALSWRERLMSGPSFQLESLIGAETSQARDSNVPYFSPDHDVALQAGLEGQWLTWKSDDRQFFQVAGISAGGYRQADFATKPLWTLRYEHRWELGPKLQLRYGLSLAGHPYDGVKERQRSLFLSLLVPLS